MIDDRCSEYGPNRRGVTSACTAPENVEGWSVRMATSAGARS